MGPHHKRVIAVVGSSKPSPHSLELAREVGRLVVEHGCSLVCGGLGGIMDAACQGAQEAKAELLAASPGLDPPQVIGVLPGADKTSANPHVDVVFPTAMGYTRNALVVLCADGVIAIEGGSGTLSEIAYAWQFGKPVAALVPSGGWAARLAGEQLDEKRPDCVHSARDAREAVSFIVGQMGVTGEQR
ncbi:MAG: TIGR00725 family protein [Pseudomonadota bacterium]